MGPGAGKQTDTARTRAAKRSSPSASTDSASSSSSATGQEQGQRILHVDPLQGWLQHMHNVAATMPKSASLESELVLRVGSMCSGVGSCHLVCALLERHGLLPPKVRFEHTFVVESDDLKREILLSAKEDLGAAKYVFCEVGAFSKNADWECRSERYMKSPGCDLLIAGTSCKDLSPLNNAPASLCFGSHVAYM